MRHFQFLFALSLLVSSPAWSDEPCSGSMSPSNGLPFCGTVAWRNVSSYVYDSGVSAGQALSNLFGDGSGPCTKANCSVRSNNQDACLALVDNGTSCCSWSPYAPNTQQGDSSNPANWKCQNIQAPGYTINSTPPPAAATSGDGAD